MMKKKLEEKKRRRFVVRGEKIKKLVRKTRRKAADHVRRREREKETNKE
jgi:hypothetical protein